MFESLNYGKIPLTDTELIKALILQSDIYGYSKDGQIITFSRGGSDITGSILAASVDADVYENWTESNFDIDEIRDEFKVGSYIEHNDRIYRIDYILSSHSTNTCEGWPNQYIIFGLSAADVHTRVYFFDLNKFKECAKRVDKDAFIKSEEEYLKRKKEEFESLKEGDIRYCWKKYDPYGYITLAKIVRTYMTSGENNMFVEYELHNMSDRTNKVETFIKEFNDFRHTFTDSDLNAIGLSNIKTIE